MSKRKLILLVVFFVAILAVGIIFWLNRRSDNSVSRIINETPQQVSRNDGDSANSNQQDADENTDSTPQKDPAPPSTVKVTEPPLVYTGYGHAQGDPLKLSQETSTTCTTVAGVDCYINFKSSDGKTAKLSAKKTDSQGVAIWNWTGKEVGSGTWSVTAVAGNKVSAVETIYIQ